jgi:hypothetical protein
MKKLLLVITLLSLNVFASQNPQIRVCRISQGNFEVFDIGTDEIGHCNLGKASIDTISLMQIRFEGEKSLAVQALEFGDRGCAFEVVDGVNNEHTRELCLYRDGSSIELETLKKGPNHIDNRRLMAILKPL